MRILEKLEFYFFGKSAITIISAKIYQQTLSMSTRIFGFFYFYFNVKFAFCFFFFKMNLYLDYLSSNIYNSLKFKASAITINLCCAIPYPRVEFLALQGV